MNREDFASRYQRMLDEQIILKHTTKNKLGLQEFHVGRIDTGAHDHIIIMTNRQPTELKCDCKDYEYRLSCCKHIIATAIGWAQDFFAPQYTQWAVFLDGKDAKDELKARQHNGQNVKAWDWKINGFFVVAWEITKETAEASTDVLTEEMWEAKNGFD